MTFKKLTKEQNEAIYKFSKKLKSLELSKTKIFQKNKNQIFDEQMMFEMMIFTMGEFLDLSETRLKAEIKKMFNRLIIEENKQLFAMFDVEPSKKQGSIEVSENEQFEI